MTFLSASSATASSSSTPTATSSTTKPGRLGRQHHHLGLFPPSSSSRASTPTTPSSSTSLVPSSTLSLPLKPSSTSSQQQQHPSIHHGVRAHLAELLPLQRHALFDVKLTIHQLWNVPLVSGEFSVRWKFQHVHRERGAAGIRRPGTPSTFTLMPSGGGNAGGSGNGRLTPDVFGGGFLTNFNLNNGFGSGWSGSGFGSEKGKEKGKGREMLVIDEMEHDFAMNADAGNTGTLRPSGASMLSIPSTSEEGSSSSVSLSLSPRRHSLDLPNAHETQSKSRNSFSGSSVLGFGLGNSNADESNLNNGLSGNGSAGTSTSTSTGTSTNANGASDASSHSHDSRGRTPYVLLRDHHVKWGQTVHVTVQMGIQRDTQELQPCELKLAVEQLSTPSNPGSLPTSSFSSSSNNLKLGAVHLNLAEYVDKGAVTRRYLLRQSKTNATLQVTLELTHAGGESNYKAPPLQKGEVMAGVSALLEKSAVGGAPRPRPAYDRSASRPQVKTHRRGTDRRDVLGLGLALAAGGGGVEAWDTPIIPTVLGGGVAGDLELGGPGVGALKTTENIIEAIFNPVPSSSPAPSPFTYYVPAGSSRSGTGMGTGQGSGGGRPLTPSSLRSNSMRSSSIRSATSLSASAGGSGGTSAETSGETDLAPELDKDGGAEDAEGVTYAEPESYDGGVGIANAEPPSSSARSDRSVPFSISFSSSSHGHRDGENERGNVDSHANADNASGDARGNVSAATSTSTGPSGTKKWWKKFSEGLSRPSSPAPTPAPALPPSSSPLPPPSPIPSYGLGPGHTHAHDHGHYHGSGSASLPTPSPAPSLGTGGRTTSSGSIASTGSTGSSVSASVLAHTHTHSPHSHSHAHHAHSDSGVASSVKSSPGVLLHEPQMDYVRDGRGRRSEDESVVMNGDDQNQNQSQRLSAPQIVVRGPTSVTHSNEGRSTTRRPS